MPEPKMIYSPDPTAAAHTAAMAIAFNTGSRVEVKPDPLIGLIRLLDWKETVLAIFMHEPAALPDEGGCHAPG